MSSLCVSCTCLFCVSTLQIIVITLSAVRFLKFLMNRTHSLCGYDIVLASVYRFCRLLAIVWANQRAAQKKQNTTSRPSFLFFYICLNVYDVVLCWALAPAHFPDDKRNKRRTKITLTFRLILTRIGAVTYILVLCMRRPVHFEFFCGDIRLFRDTNTCVNWDAIGGVFPCVVAYNRNKFRFFSHSAYKYRKLFYGGHTQHS